MAHANMTNGFDPSIPRNGKPTVYKVVLTGGPCGGKTTGQARLSAFFEGLGWKVFRVPEAACTLMSGGVKWPELTAEQASHFQDNLILTMLQMEQTFFDLAAAMQQNCLVICDRGVFDATAYMPKEDWDRLKKVKGWNDVGLRDERYNQVIHMVSAAVGAEAFYTCDEHATRYEGLSHATQLDEKAAKAWVGHPYFDVIDNSTDFEKKIMRMISAVCSRIGLSVADRLDVDSRKRKFLLAHSPDLENFPCEYRDFVVVHDYLGTKPGSAQVRIRRRGQDGNWTYTHTVGKPAINGQRVEVRMQITPRDYQMLLAQNCPKRYAIYKIRRCFLWDSQYYQMDIYQEPCHPRVLGLTMLETYTTQQEEMVLPPFLQVEKEVTKDKRYSMYHLSLKEEYLKPELKEGFKSTLVNGTATSKELKEGFKSTLVNGTATSKEGSKSTLVNGSGAS